MSDTIPICEIYPAVQAEGQMRYPAVFVRVWGCNLRCRFNGSSCDTPYAVISGKPNQLSLNEVLHRILSYDHKHVVFTGGEPLMYQDQIIRILKKLPLNRYVQIETNGTIKPKRRLQSQVDLFNVSPKLTCSNQPEAYEDKRINIKVLKSFPKQKTTFKFVADTLKDIEEIEELKEILKNRDIILMPQGDKREIVLKNIPKVMDWCLEYGYGFTNRDHILGFDDKRGV